MAKTKNRKQRGATQIEFVLSIVVFFFVVWGVIELSMVVYTMNVLSDAAREGVRYAIVHGVNNGYCSGPNAVANCATPDVTASKVQAVVLDYAKYSLHDISGMSTPVVTYLDGSNDPPNRVSVSVSYTYVPYINLPGLSPVLKASAEGRIVN